MGQTSCGVMAQRCNSLNGRELPRGRALTLPVPHNLVHSLTFMSLFKYLGWTNDRLSVCFLAVVFLALNTGSPSLPSLFRPPHICWINNKWSERLGCGSLHQLPWGESHNAPGPGTTVALGPDNEAEVMGKNDVPIVPFSRSLIGASAAAHLGFKPPLVAPPCCTYIKVCSCGQLHLKSTWGS